LGKVIIVDLDILKEKIETISALTQITKSIGLILVVLNVIGWVYNKIDLTIFLSFIVIILFWLWALDTQVGRIEKILKDKYIIKEEDMKMKDKRGLTEVGKWIVWILVGLVILFIVSRIFF